MIQQVVVNIFKLLPIFHYMLYQYPIFRRDRISNAFQNLNCFLK